jgi:tetratricopeptide (TPR) repeat protein
MVCVCEFVTVCVCHFVCVCGGSAALRRNPNDLAVLHRYGLFLYNKKRDMKRAEGLFQRVLSLNGEYVEALVDYAVLCWNRYRMADRDRKDDDDKHKAERMLRQALAVVQAAGLHHSRAYSKLALLLDADAKRDEALPLFRLAGCASPPRLCA